MRNLVNVMAGLVFLVGFPAVLLLDAAVRYGRDGEALVHSAHSAGLREAMVEATATLVLKEVAADPKLASVNRVFVRGTVNHVLSAEWFDGSIRSLHAALLAVAAGAAREAAVDIEPFKQALEVRLGLLEERAGATCRDLFGNEACRDRGQAQQLISVYRRVTERAIARIPDHVLLWPDAGRAEHLESLVAARWAGLGLLIAAVFALVVANWHRPAVLGGILVVGACVFLACAFALRLIASGPVARFLLARAGVDDRADEPVRIAADGLHRLVYEIVVDATRPGLVIAAGLAVLGLALAVFARSHGRPLPR